MNYFKSLSLKVKILIVVLIVLILIALLLVIFGPKGQSNNQKVVEKLPPSQRTGEGDQYSRDVKKDQTQNKDYYQKGETISKFRETLPVEKEDFKVEYSYPNTTYVVHLTGANKEQSKASFQKYLTGQGLGEQDINIAYNSAESEYFVLETNITPSKQFGVVEPVVIRFSEPVDQPTTVVTLDPYITAFYDYNESFTELTITPVQGWGFNKTIKVTVSSQSKDINGEPLAEDYTYTFTTKAYSGI